MFPVFTTFFSNRSHFHNVFFYLHVSYMKKNSFFCTYNLQQNTCRYLQRCALETLLKKGHWKETPCILWIWSHYDWCDFWISDFTAKQNFWDNKDSKFPCTFGLSLKIMKKRSKKWIPCYNYFSDDSQKAKSKEKKENFNPTTYYHFNRKICGTRLSVLRSSTLCLFIFSLYTY